MTDTLDFENSNSDLTSSNDAPNFKFEVEDWTSFRTLEGLQRKAGVAKEHLPMLVMKELADNALDELMDAPESEVEIGCADGRYFVRDYGRGMGAPEDVAKLFSIKRPLISTKLLRLPTRGALGNGLRVVAGAVLATGGSLFVTTRNCRIELRPERDGSTTILSEQRVDFPIGNKVEIGFGSTFPIGSVDDANLFWAKRACALNNRGTLYSGQSSPYWYDASQFHDVLYAAGARPVRELIARLDGCSGAKAGEIIAEAGLTRTLCIEITSEQAKRLLIAARNNVRKVNPRRLGAVGDSALTDAAYSCTSEVVRFGSSEPYAEIPYVAEAWATEK
jgi:hypothetical protein